MPDLYSNDKIRARSERIVQEDVIYCVSSLIWELSRCDARYMLQIDDELRELAEIEDYEEAAERHIQDDMDRAELIEFLEDNDVELPRGEGPDEDDDVTLETQELRTLALETLRDSVDCQEFCDDHHVEPDRSEIYEHWIVSGWLARKLEERGHVVQEVLGLTVWGRPTTGQAISMDGVMLDIANDLENL